MNRFKFNSGNGAVVCNDCNRIIISPISEEDAKVFKDSPCNFCAMEPLDTFVNRLYKIGINIQCISNYPWVYLDKVNGKKVKELNDSEHGFTIGYLPIQRHKKFNFITFSKIFKILRKYR